MTTNEVSVGGTLNVLLAARDEGAHRVVFASSSSMYGTQTALLRHYSLAKRVPPVASLLAPVFGTKSGQGNRVRELVSI
jgi:nucleoside-diphosphate-sugar epimerase